MGDIGEELPHILECSQGPESTADHGSALIELSIVVAVLAMLLGFVLVQNKQFEDLAIEQVEQAAALMRLPEHWGILERPFDSRPPELLGTFDRGEPDLEVLKRMLRSGISAIRPPSGFPGTVPPGSPRSEICAGIVRLETEELRDVPRFDLVVTDSSSTGLDGLCWEPGQPRWNEIQESIFARYRVRGDLTQYFVVFQFIGYGETIDDMDIASRYQWRVMFGGVEESFLGFLPTATPEPSSSASSSGGSNDSDDSSADSSEPLESSSSTDSSDSSGSSDSSDGSSVNSSSSAASS